MSRKGLMQQDLSKLDVTQLYPLSPEVISRQANINIGTIGHVAHGMSSVVKAISPVQIVVYTLFVSRMSWSARKTIGRRGTCADFEARDGINQ